MDSKRLNVESNSENNILLTQIIYIEYIHNLNININMLIH